MKSIIRYFSIGIIMLLALTVNVKADTIYVDLDG